MSIFEKFDPAKIPTKEIRALQLGEIQDKIQDVIDGLAIAHSTMLTLDHGYQGALRRIRAIAIEESTASPACAAIVKVIDDITGELGNA